MDYFIKPHSETKRHWYEEPAASQAKSRPQKRRKAQSGEGPSSGKEIIDLTVDTPPRKKQKQKQEPKPKPKPKEPSEEKRLRRWRTHAPQSYQEIRHRALTQRMFVLDRQRQTDDADHPVETISLAGTTGNVYTITVDKVPSCDCPHAGKGNQCKHIIYVLTRVLRVPEHLEYQLAFLSSELREIFASAPPLPSETAEGSTKDGNRKPIDGECPICCVDFEPQNSSEEVVFCKAACGNNVHKECFQQWAASRNGKEVTCPFCRTPWQGDEGGLKDAVKMGVVNKDGYVNVASQLGLSEERDYSTYHRPWVRRVLGDY